MLKQAIISFADNLSALRDFVALIESLLEKNEKRTAWKNRRNLIPALLAMRSVNPEFAEQVPEDKVEFLKRQFGGEISILPTEGGKGCEVKVSGDAARRFQSALKAVGTAGHHRPLLYRSSLISLVSACESFLSQVIRTYFNKFPEAAAIKDKTMTLEDLKNIGSIEEAQQRLIDLKVDEVMWGGFEDWLKFLRGPMKLSMGYIEDRKDEFAEVFLRRNVCIHNNGIVHASYMAKIGPDLQNGIRIGDHLRVTSTYLKSAIDLLELKFILIGAELWKQVEPTNAERSEAITDHVVIESLMEERWMLGEGLSFFIMNDKQLPERDQLIGRMNFWQTVKWQGRFDEVKKEIKQADFSAKMNYSNSFDMSC